MIYLCDCPTRMDQGILRPAVLENGRIVLICDEGYDVWLDPQDLSQVEPFWPSEPDWEIVDGLHIRSGTWRWADEADLQNLYWNVTWKRRD